jgi:hypothetical protein
MKVAILICGLARSYKETFSSFKHAFSDHDYDAYMHTWILGPNSLKSRTNAGEALDSIQPEREDLIRCFNLKKLTIEEQDIREIPSIPPEMQGNTESNAICFHESIKRCLKTVEGEYDIYLVVRPDLFYYDKIHLMRPEPGKIYVPYINNLYEGKDIIRKNRDKHPGSIFDMMYSAFAYGTREDIQVYADFTDHYLEICQDSAYFLSGKVDLNPDRALAIFAKIIRKKELVEFRMKHGMQRIGWIQAYSW